ncbi:MAG: hypothetical protein K2J48_07865 [Muribaculaceae bacterium]|nr:hypothetical protein [Muribaculaceae bacterium]MDE6009765.1 hypothetical protein [Muribaculaceae bacterium]MDE6792982.1 hypothetical protein [Muribaculaceae bacterium]
MKVMKLLPLMGICLLMASCGSKSAKSEDQDTTQNQEQVVGFIEEMPSSDSSGVISEGVGVEVDSTQQN